MLFNLFAITTVVALTFVKIFPFSSQLFAAAAALAFSLFLDGGRWRSWFEVQDGWLRTISWGVIGGVVVIAADSALFSVYTLLGMEPMRLGRFAAVRGNLGELFQWLILIWLFIGLTEELISRAFLIDRWLQVLPHGKLSIALAIVLSSITFSIVHYYEGPAGLISNLVAGLIFGTLYALRRRTLASNVIAHSLADSLGLIAIYFGLVS